MLTSGISTFLWRILGSYPDIKESYEMFYKVFQKLIENAGNPLNIEIKEKSDIKIEEKKAEKINFRRAYYYIDEQRI